MAKAILIQNMDDKCNQAINKKRAELLLEGKDFKKSEVVVEILHEWLDAKSIVPSYAINGTTLING
jgi:hypothetical protein